MNLFQKYGIKEVVDVVFYSITEVGDEEFYTPVLFLDTLKVSTLEKSAEKVVAKGGKGNKKLITWNFGKEITLNLEDALFSPASMSMIWGGRLEAKLSAYTSAIVKCNIANKYGALHYSTKAYPSPSLTDEEWELVFREMEGFMDSSGTMSTSSSKYGYDGYEETANKEEFPKLDLPNVMENRTNVIKAYFKRLYESDLEGAKDEDRIAMPNSILQKLLYRIDEINKLGYIDTDIYDLEVIDRMEKCIVKDRYGLTISTRQQKENLLKYYRDDRTKSYTIFYDAKTMLPLLHLEDDGKIVGWNEDEEVDNDLFTIKMGTVYYKWTRTVKYKEADDDGILGRTLVIDAETFPDAYKIVGECYIREQKTGKDQRYQFTIHRANVSADTSITLQADGDPTTFSMQVDVLTPPNDIMIELKQFDIEDDLLEGGTRIVPQKAKYTYTPANIEMIEHTDVKNDEIY